MPTGWTNVGPSSRPRRSRAAKRAIDPQVESGGHKWPIHRHVVPAFESIPAGSCPGNKARAYEGCTANVGPSFDPQIESGGHRGGMGYRRIGPRTRTIGRWPRNGSTPGQNLLMRSCPPNPRIRARCRFSPSARPERGPTSGSVENAANHENHVGPFLDPAGSMVRAPWRDGLSSNWPPKPAPSAVGRGTGLRRGETGFRGTGATGRVSPAGEPSPTHGVCADAGPRPVRMVLRRIAADAAVLPAKCRPAFYMRARRQRRRPMA